MQHVSTLTTCSSFAATYVAVYSSNNVCMHPYLSSTHVNKYAHACVLIFSLALPVLLRPPPHLASYNPSTSHVTSPLPHMTPPLLMSLLHCLIRPLHFSTASYGPSTSHVTSPLPHMTPPLLMSLLHCLIRPLHFSTASYGPSTSHVTSPLPHMTLPLLMSLLHCLIRPLHFSCHFSTVSFTLTAHHTQAGRPSCSSKDQSLQLLLQERLQVPLQRTYPTTA